MESYALRPLIESGMDNRHGSFPGKGMPRGMLRVFLAFSIRRSDLPHLDHEVTEVRRINWTVPIRATALWTRGRVCLSTPITDPSMYNPLDCMKRERESGCSP